ncbi:hypothetical protein GJ744_003820 [Endocarpon pusillum]|uniref:Uncharacterized protein n=1 Tax=Endocarpon pusillum TaxID=364733 RepID=A0A8H7ARI5_9EURO|nr:hypothetical protein GJ744_003820 [Endocarpon pusillum]
MTAVEAMESDELNSKPEEEAPGNLHPPLSTAPAVVEGSRKRTRKHTTAYREAFGDSQEDPTAGIKRGRAGGIL